MLRHAEGTLFLCAKEKDGQDGQQGEVRLAEVVYAQRRPSRIQCDSEGDAGLLMHALKKKARACIVAAICTASHVEGHMSLQSGFHPTQWMLLER